MPEHQQIQQSERPGASSQRRTTSGSQVRESNPASIIQRAGINPKSMTSADVLQLQRTIGNRAVGRLLSGVGKASTAQRAPVQRQEITEEEEPLQTKIENNTGMPNNLRAGVESLSGIDMSDVKVHYNSNKPAKVGALAYAQGTDIHVAPGQERHLPHEAWHVVQQAQGRVQPTMQLRGGIPVNDDVGLEREADVMGAKASTMGQNVFFRQGAYEPGSREGNKLTAHELTHAVQRNRGKVMRSGGSMENLQNRSSVRTISRKRTIKRDTILHRVRRIIGRWINNKKLPVNTYRWDKRPPDSIAVSGFQPWNPGGNIQIEEHVKNVFMSGERQRQVAKYESQWVSTGAYGMLKKLDPTFAQQVLNTNLYRIDTTIAKNTGGFSDVNDYFDKKNKDRPFASQREWLKLGGIPPAAVVAWMTGKNFIGQYDLKNGAPDENALTGWQSMPTND